MAGDHNAERAVADQQIILEAGEWIETTDPDTGARRFRATVAAGDTCDIVVKATTDGAGGIAYEYSCTNVQCDGNCELEETDNGDGTMTRRCNCVT